MSKITWLIVAFMVFCIITINSPLIGLGLLFVLCLAIILTKEKE